jgi:hypothetical protein
MLCKKCFEEKLIENFPIANNGKSLVRRHVCKSCLELVLKEKRRVQSKENVKRVKLWRIKN